MKLIKQTDILNKEHVLKVIDREILETSINLDKAALDLKYVDNGLFGKKDRIAKQNTVIHLIDVLNKLRWQRKDIVSCRENRFRLELD